MNLTTNREGIHRDIDSQRTKELTKELIDDKTGRIDVRATTVKGEEIDIEVQIKDQNNMDKRTLFYWSKLYLEGIKKGDDYKGLNKVITINILDFEFLGTNQYHSSFHLWEDEQKDYLLTDLVEIHFIELPKFRTLQEKNFKESPLQRWLAFLEKDINPNMLKELMSMEPAIKMAEEKLDYLSSDPYTIELYKAREDSEPEKANFYSSGSDDKAREIARKMLDAGMDIQLITQMTGLTQEEIEKI